MKYTLKAILESIIIGVLSTLIAGVLFLVPVLNTLVLLFPVPLIVLGVRRGVWAGILGLIISSAIISIIIHPYLGFLVFIFNIIPLLGITWAFNKMMKANECVIVSSASILASTLINFKAFELIIGKSFFDFISENIQEFFTVNAESSLALAQLYESLGILDRVYSPEEFALLMAGQLKMLTPIVPSILLIFSIVAGVALFLLSRLILKRFSIAVPYVPPFRNWALPRGTGRGFLLIMIIAVIGMFMGINNFDIVLYTITALFSFIFFIQGLATAAFFLKASNLPQIVQVLILIVAFIFMSAALSFIGLFEQIFGFRNAYSNRTRP